MWFLTSSPDKLDAQDQQALQLSAYDDTHTHEISVMLMGRHTLFQTVVQGHRDTQEYAERALKPRNGQRMTQRE